MWIFKEVKILLSFRPLIENIRLIRPFVLVLTLFDRFPSFLDSRRFLFCCNKRKDLFSKVVNTLTKGTSLCINLSIDGDPTSSLSHSTPHPIHLVCERILYPPSLDPKFVSHNTDTLSSSISHLGVDYDKQRVVLPQSKKTIHYDKQRVVLPQSKKTQIISSNHETLTKFEGHHP